MAEELILDSLWAEGEDGGGADLGGADGEQVDTTQQDGQETGSEGGEAAAGKDGAGKPGEQEAGGNGRNNPDAIRKHLAELKANPETATIAKSLNDRLGKTRGYEEVYPTVREAREVRQLLDSVGGKEAVTAAVESHATMQRVDALLESGNPSVVAELFQQAPEGMVKLGGPILDAIQKANPEAYQKLLVPHAVAMLSTDGLPGAMNALVDAFNADNKDGMKDIIGRMVQYLSGLMQGAKPPKVDPERAKFEEEKSAFEKARETEAVSKVFNENLSYSAGKIDTALAADIKRLNLGPKAVEKLRQQVWKEIETLRNGDQTFKNTINGRFKGGKPSADAVTHLNGFTDRNLTAAVDNVVTTYYGERKPAAAGTVVDPTAPKGKPAAAGAGKGAAAQPGVTKVAAPPNRQDIDYSDPRTNILDGVAVLKAGKRLVSWR